MTQAKTENLDQSAIDMADHTLERLNINADLWSRAELEILGKDLLCYAAILTLGESK